ncbi:autotransporter assembly complex protein TamA [Conservatibacter flavescens]|uniref:Translocation and assembly module subunit TamA n=1 Tax=Conservatibacter flavescens TaxID=28161 RepID=A0A2M8S511_9PAST|nr:autotransporter assembly complex family protein [Conservatibacter flavescens]PJG86240.1 hypothetical protein CVP05_03075 [Conservatibacter flavescens]
MLFFSANIAFAAQSVSLKVEGIHNAALNDNVRIHVNAINPEEADGSERYQSLVSEAIDKALRAEGYYGSIISYHRNGQELIANVQVGEAVKIAEADVLIIGQASDDEAFQTLDKELPKPGTQLNHGTYDDYKSALNTLAIKRGYFDAEFLVHRLEVMPSTHQAWWRLLFDSGDRYHYGDIRFHHSQIREDYLRNMLKLKSGEPYLINDLSTLTSDFSSSNWFSSVLIQPELNDKQKIVNLDVSLYPRKKNSMEVGIGYSSDVGPRFQLGWSKPWINNRGHSFRSDLYLSAPKQTFEATYKMPLLKNPLDYYYEFVAGVENEDKNDTKSLAATMGALRYWNHPTGWQYSLGMRARYDSFTQANQSEKTLLLYPTASVNRTRLRGGLFPDWGDAQRLTVDLGRKLWFSDVNFLSIRASTSWIRTFADNHRFYVRGELGWLHTNDLARMPPALRFFAGGDRSVRGYGYKKISPKNHEGKLVGGSRLATGTLEYQYQVYQDWWLATFADTGLAANSFSTDELRYGAGIGLRWASPVGAVKIDIATPIRDKDNSKNIQFYIGLGSEL